MTRNEEIKLKVAEAIQDDVYKGIARIDSSLMKKLDLHRGDIISIKGGRESFVVIDKAYPADEGAGLIRIDGITRKNAKTGIGELVSIKKAEIKTLKKIIIAPAQQGIMVQGNVESFRSSLLGRPFSKGDVFVMGTGRKRKDFFSEEFEDFNDFFGDLFSQFGMGMSGLSQIRFVVVSTSPNQPGIVSEDTEIVLSPKAVEVSEDFVGVPQVTYEDIGGLTEEVKKIREMVELPLKHPEIFARLGIEPPKGVLLYGPPGTGKTLLAKAVANESEANFILLNGPEIMSKFYGESEKKVRDIFEEASKNSPAIIFIDEIDAIAPKREEVTGEVERRVVSQLLTMMDGLQSRGKVIVIGATNRPNALDPALRRPGRFDREIEVGVPDKEGRLQILKIHTRGMPLEAPFYLDIARKVIEEEKNEIGSSKLDARTTNANNEIKKIKEESLELEKMLGVLTKEISDLESDLDKLKEREKDLYEKDPLKISNSLTNLRKQISSIEKSIALKTKEKKELSKKIRINEKRIESLHSDITNDKKQISLIKKSEKLSKLSELLNLSEKSLEFALFGLTGKQLIRIIDIYLENLSSGDKSNIDKEALLTHLQGDSPYNFFDPKFKVLEDYSKNFKLTKKFIKEKIIPSLDKNRESEVIEYLEYLIKNFVEEDLTAEIFSGSVDENLKNELKTRFLEKMKDEIATKTHGFVGADLQALTKESAMSTLRRNLDKFNLDKDEAIPEKVLQSLKITKDDFENALKVVRPSAMREVLVETPNVKWEDVGGIENTKRELREAIEWPLKYPESFKRMGIRSPKGVLLYGPPGTGKTLLAKAVANESEANFIQVKGPELLSMWVGKSEEGVRKVFERARQVSPCVIFFDEIDSLAGRRGLHECGSKVTESVLNQLLVEMDGIEELSNVIVVGATNRPDILDPALLRPGRFDRIVFVPVPDEKGRLEILKIHTKNTPIENKEKIIEKLSKETEGYTGADIESLVREAAMLALRENKDAKEVKESHFKKAMEKVAPSVTRNDLERYKSIEKKYLRSAKSALPETSYTG